MCNAFWGGRYNPILAVDRPESTKLVEVFRPDFLIPMGDDPAITAFVAKFSYLLNPLMSEELFIPASQWREGEAKLLDIQNLIVHRREFADWKRLLDDGFRMLSWSTEDDPLADAFLALFGGYPDPAEVGLDYAQIVSQATTAVEIPIAPDGTVLRIYSTIPRSINFAGLRSSPTTPTPTGFFPASTRATPTTVRTWSIFDCEPAGWASSFRLGPSGPNGRTPVTVY